MKITPEIIATKIWKWEFPPEGALGDRAYWSENKSLNYAIAEAILEAQKI